MRDGGVKYEEYSNDELKQALAAINDELYPSNYKNLTAELRSRGLSVGSPAPTGRPAASPKKAETLESMAGTMLLSVAVLVYAAHGLYRNDFALGFRGRTHHFHDTDLLAFFAMLLVAVPTNIVKLYSWIRDGGMDSKRYRTANAISRIALAAYIAYLLFGLFRGN